MEHAINAMDLQANNALNVIILGIWIVSISVQKYALNRNSEIKQIIDVERATVLVQNVQARTQKHVLNVL